MEYRTVSTMTSRVRVPNRACTMQRKDSLGLQEVRGADHLLHKIKGKRSQETLFDANARTLLLFDAIEEEEVSYWW